MGNETQPRRRGSTGEGWHAPKPVGEIRLGPGGRVKIVGEKTPEFRPGEQLMRRGQSKIEIKRGKGR
jgi:hypothetical protein